MASDRDPPVLDARRLGKRFGGVAALRDVDLTLRQGEVHALIGANGAGKSTLVKMLAGVVRPDVGEIRVRGRPMAFSGPRAAHAAGIVAVHQELSLFQGLSVAANVLIGQEPRRGGLFVDRRAERRRAAALLAALGVADIDPDTKLGDLSLAQAQIVEIAKAISSEPGVLILDEPTSALSVVEVERLMQLIKRLRAQGAAIVFISHRLGEIERIADRVSILRSGEKVGEFAAGEFGRAKALSLMLGDNWRPDRAAPAPTIKVAAGPPALRVQSLTLRRRFSDVTFDLQPGEILGLAGLEGQGQKDLLFALFGIFRRGLEGTIELSGRRLRPRRPRQAIDAGVAFIPDDRKSLGGFLGLSVAENIAIATLERVNRGLALNPAAEAALVRDMIARLKIVCSSAAAPLASLSGGNQQKVVAAKWLTRKMPVYLFCDPTRGVDAGARSELFQVIRELVAGGAGVLFYSTDISEFPALCNRVLVFRDGRIAGALSGDAVSEQTILDLSFHESRHAAE